MGVGLLPPSPAATRLTVGLAGDEAGEAGSFFFLLQLFDLVGVEEGSGASVEDGTGEEEGVEGEPCPETKVATAGPGKV